jgi:hypothetical protein
MKINSSIIILQKTQTGRGLPQFEGSVDYIFKLRQTSRCNFDRRIIWRINIDLNITKALRTLVQIYSLMKSEKLSIKSKMTQCKQ